MDATAVAIATQISRNTDEPGTGRDTMDPETIDALVEPIHQALQNLVQNRQDEANGRRMRLTNPLRMFGLRSRTSNSGRSQSSNLSAGNIPPRGDAGEQEPGTLREEAARNITVVVVAIRPAVTNIEPPSQSPRASTNARASLMALPPLQEVGDLNSPARNQGHRHQLNRRLRLSHVRHVTQRVVPSNVDWLQNSNFVSSRVLRTLSFNRAAEVSPTSSRYNPLGSQDSPPGPNPPPSTPAEHTVSYLSSDPAQPSRRQSFLSTFQSLHGNGSSAHDELGSEDINPLHTERTHRSNRQRRRSESDAARHRLLGSGSARRNGVVEPDSLGEGEDRSSRNWLIYVIGTNASGDHHAWTLPGIFNDVSSLHCM